MTISPTEALTRCIEHREIFHDEMLHLMRMLMRGEMSPRRLLAQRPARKKRTAAFNIRPRVGFDNEASTTATVVEVEGLDQQGFLYDVT